ERLGDRPLAVGDGFLPAVADRLQACKGAQQPVIRGCDPESGFQLTPRFVEMTVTERQVAQAQLVPRQLFGRQIYPLPRLISCLAEESAGLLGAAPEIGPAGQARRNREVG